MNRVSYDLGIDNREKKTALREQHALSALFFHTLCIVSLVALHNVSTTIFSILVINIIIIRQKKRRMDAKAILQAKLNEPTVASLVIFLSHPS